MESGKHTKLLEQVAELASAVRRLEARNTVLGMLCEDAEVLIDEKNSLIADMRSALEWYAGDGSTYDGLDIGERARKSISKVDAYEGATKDSLPD